MALAADPTHPLADVGVKLIIAPYAQFDGTFRSLDDWSVDAKAGIQGNVAPFGDFVGRPWQDSIYFTLFDYELARGSSHPGSDSRSGAAGEASSN